MMPSVILKDFITAATLFDGSAFGDEGVLSVTGEDIGVTRDPSQQGRFEVAFSFQTVDLGIVPAGAQFSIEYKVMVSTDVPTFSELLKWGFSDPLNVSGTESFPA